MKNYICSIKSLLNYKFTHYCLDQALTCWSVCRWVYGCQAPAVFVWCPELTCRSFLSHKALSVDRKLSLCCFHVNAFHLLLNSSSHYINRKILYQHTNVIDNYLIYIYKPQINSTDNINPWKQSTTPRTNVGWINDGSS